MTLQDSICDTSRECSPTAESAKRCQARSLPQQGPEHQVQEFLALLAETFGQDEGTVHAY